jgi:hypothetical protein
MPSIVEIYIGIICACLPCLKAFAKHIFPGVFERFTPEQERITLNTVKSTLRSLGGYRDLGRNLRSEDTTAVDKKGSFTSASASAATTANGSAEGSLRSTTGKKQGKDERVIVQAEDIV